MTGIGTLLNKALRDYEKTPGKTGAQCEDNIYQSFLKYFDIVEEQPNGSQRFPDFKIHYNGKIIQVESKSSKSGKPMWNIGLPERNSLYIFTSVNTNRVTWAFGDDLMPQVVYDRIKAFWGKQRAIHKEFSDTLPHPFNVVYRPMFDPYCPEISNPLRNTARITREERILSIDESFF